MNKIDISGLPKHLLLKELYNNAYTIVGMDITPDAMTEDHAKRLTDHCLVFEYLNGKALFINLHGDLFDCTFYDREREYEFRQSIRSKIKTANEIIDHMRIINKNN